MLFICEGQNKKDLSIHIVYDYNVAYIKYMFKFGIL